MFQKVIVILAVVALALHLALPYTVKAGNRTAYDELQHYKLVIDKGLEPLSLSFNGRGLPVLFVKKGTQFFGIQFEEHDGLFTPSFIYDVVCR